MAYPLSPEPLIPWPQCSVEGGTVIPVIATVNTAALPEFRGESIHVHVWPSPFAVYLKLPQCC